MNGRVQCRMWVRCLILFMAAAAITLPGAEAKKTDASEALFKEETIRTLRIEVSPSVTSSLRQGNRDYVRANVSDGTRTLRDVGVRLKGHTTFQPIEKKPSFALKFNEFVSGQEYSGLTKLVLNNSAQDASYMREVLASQLYRDAGIPAARATHARVFFNGRDLGMYVLVEGINKNFLKREFGTSGGNVYEGEMKDVNQKLDQEHGDDTSQSDLNALVAAASTPAAQRAEKLGAVLDVPQFTSYLAMEMLLASVNGYAFMQNNYRVFHHPKSGKFVFLPHGLDSAFGTAGLKPPTNSIVVKALWELPEFQKSYGSTVREMAEKHWNTQTLTNRVNATAKKLTAAMPNKEFTTQVEREARTLRYQIEQQGQFIQAELKRGK
jgi:spore coat protein H